MEKSELRKDIEDLTYKDLTDREYFIELFNKISYYFRNN
jgi:hypothetical protein